MPIQIRSNSTLLIFFSSTSAATCYSLWKLIQWRARKLARGTVEKAVIQEGPLTNAANFRQRQQVLTAATSRASQWSTIVQHSQPMEDQVGGISAHKRPMLTLSPDYVLKPLLMDHRGIREVHFYESVFHSIVASGDNRARNFSRETRQFTNPSISTCVINALDTLAMAFAIFFQDPLVIELEERVNRARQMGRRQADLLRRLAPLVPTYYGVVGQSTNTTAHLTTEAHLLLKNVVSSNSFTTPCVMDVKMGQETFEPDAPLSKIARESAKYTPMQTEFGLRIVGMRVVEYLHGNTEEHSIRTYPKSYGRSLTTKDALLDAFRTFLCPASHRCISNFLIQLRPLLRWMEENDTLQFCASSLLLVYEGDASVGRSDVVALKMIDFGRVRHRQGGDPGYRHGLQTLQGLLIQLQNEQAKTAR